MYSLIRPLRTGSAVLCGPLVFVDEATEGGSAFDPLLGKVGDGGSRVGAVAAGGCDGVAVRCSGPCTGQDRPQMSLAIGFHCAGCFPAAPGHSVCHPDTASPGLGQKWYFVLDAATERFHPRLAPSGDALAGGAS